MTQQVKLPSGRVIEVQNMPQGMTKARMKELLIRNDKATESDFVVPFDPTKERGVGATGEGVDVGQFLKENLDIPAGIAGTAMGMKIAAPTANPLIIGISGVVGGAMGTFGGTVGSDVLTQEDIDFHDAVEKSLDSAQFDVAMLLGGKGLKSAWIIGKKALGHTPEETAELILKKAREGQATGSRESLQASQNILQEKGASFSRSQTGQANALEIFSEKIGQSGLVSEQATAKQMTKANDAARSALTDVINRSDMRGGATPREVGETMYSIVEAGRSALSQSYGDALEEIQSTVANKVVNTTPVKKAIEKFLNSNTMLAVDELGDKAVKESSLRPLARDFLENKLQGVLSLPNMSARDFLSLDKALNAEIRALRAQGGATTDTLAAQQLGDAVADMRTAFEQVLKQADPKAAKEYIALKKTYADSMDSLMPKITATTVRSAEAGDYDSLGRMLLQQSNVSKVRAFMGSIDESYKQLGVRRGLPSEVAYNNPKEAKEAIKAGYLKGLFPDADDPTFDMSNYARLAAKYNKPQYDDMLKTVTGKDYPRVKQLMNLMNEASKTPDGNVGTLFLRGKEYSAARQATGGQIGTAATATGIGGVAGGILGGAFTLGAILMAPVFLAKAAYNPKAVNRLLAFEKTKFKSTDAMEKAATLLIDDVVRGMNEYEAAQLRAELENQ